MIPHGHRRAIMCPINNLLLLLLSGDLGLLSSRNGKSSNFLTRSQPLRKKAPELNFAFNTRAWTVSDSFYLVVSEDSDATIMAKFGKIQGGYSRSPICPGGRVSILFCLGLQWRWMLIPCMVAAQRQGTVDAVSCQVTQVSCFTPFSVMKCTS